MYKKAVFFLALSMIFCLSACNLNDVGNKEDKNLKKASTISFKEGLSEENRIWFSCSEIAKDASVFEVYIIEGGKVKVYDFGNTERPLLGNAVSMTKDEIIEFHKNSFLTAYKEINIPVIGGANGYSTKTYSYDINDYNEHPSNFEVKNIEFYTESDDSGNVTTLEQFSGKSYKFSYYSENELWEKEYYSFTADGMVSPSYIYDTIIGGFSNSTNRYLLTKCDLDTTFVFDEPDRK